MKFFVPHARDAEAALVQIAKAAGTAVPERRIATLFYTQGGRSRSATVGKPLQKGEQTVVAAILPHREGYGLFLSHPGDIAKWRGPIVIAMGAVLGTRHFEATPGARLRVAMENASVQKRLKARRELFGRVDVVAKLHGIAWDQALRKVVLNPENAELLQAAQEPRRPRKARVRLSDAELEQRMQKLEHACGGPSPEEVGIPFRQLSGVNDDIRKKT